MLVAAGTDRTPIIFEVLIALAVFLVLCVIAYGAVRAFGRFRHFLLGITPPELGRYPLDIDEALPADLCLLDYSKVSHVWDLVDA